MFVNLTADDGQFLNDYYLESEAICAPLTSFERAKPYCLIKKSAKLISTNCLMLFITSLISGCGGSGGGSMNLAPEPRIEETVAQLPPENASDVLWSPGIYEPWRNLSQICANPRNNDDYNDQQGSIANENNWIRSYSDDTYLWYDELPDIDPRTVSSTSEYFELMKTDSVTESGTPKDKYHYTEDTEAWNNYFERGANVGFGMRLTSSNSNGEPYRIFVLYSEPLSPAAEASIGRGTEIISVNNETVSDGLSQEMYDALFPAATGVETSIAVRFADSDDAKLVNMTSAEITITPVQKVDVIQHGEISVGYMLFNQHIASAEKQLLDAIQTLKISKIDELVIDMRYNGGGYLSIASQLAYMVAGESAINQVFERSTFNDKHQVYNPVTQQRIQDGLFVTETQGLSAEAGEALPTLNLSKVYILSTERTCSASEAVINGLRGIDIEVILIGGTTCGKPYGFYGVDNCGTTYLTIQIKGTNAKGFGDFGDGFVPSPSNQPVSASVGGCRAIDTISGDSLGQEEESLLSTALHHIANGTCPSSSSSSILKKQKTFGLESGSEELDNTSKWAIKILSRHSQSR